VPRSPSTRPYAGVSAVDRTAGRRRRLLDAALLQIGTSGYAASTVAAICASAGLNERYFYESFAGREELLTALYEDLERGLTGAVTRAVAQAPVSPLDRSRAGLRAFVDALDRDRRLARVWLIEVVGVSDALEARRRRTMHDFADLIVASTPPGTFAGLSEVDTALTSMALVGATHELLVDWIGGAIDADAERIANHLASLYVAAGSVTSEP
jgi:AcrR family transcriptional regulator